MIELNWNRRSIWGGICNLDKFVTKEELDKAISKVEKSFSEGSIFADEYGLVLAISYVRNISQPRLTEVTYQLNKSEKEPENMIYFPASLEKKPLPDSVELDMQTINSIIYELDVFAAKNTEIFYFYHDLKSTLGSKKVYSQEGIEKLFAILEDKSSNPKSEKFFIFSCSYFRLPSSYKSFQELRIILADRYNFNPIFKKFKTSY